MANNVLKYRDINVTDRLKRQEEWNRAIIYPIFIILATLGLTIYLLRLYYIRSQSLTIFKT